MSSGSSTMPSADSCTAIWVPYGSLSPVSETRCRPPGVSSTAFTAHLPDLQPRPLMDMDFAISCPLVRSRLPLIRFLFVRLRRELSRTVTVLLHASFRPHLAMTPLRFASTSPPPGCAGDFHPLAVEHARHTTKGPSTTRAGAFWRARYLRQLGARVPHSNFNDFFIFPKRQFKLRAL